MINSRLAKFYRHRKLLLAFSVFIAVSFYYVGTEFIAPSRNVVDKMYERIFPSKYTFFSGNKSGNYHFIAEEMVKANASSVFKLKNDTSEGATENLLKVASTPRSIGLIQEDTIDSSLFDKAYIRKNVRKVAYLYTEKLHILYWPEACPSSSGDCNEGNENFVLSADRRGAEGAKAANAARDYLSKTDVFMNLGTSNSGSRFIAHAILSGAGVDGFENREVNLPFNEAIEKFMKKEINVVFYYTGTPLNSIQTALDNGATLMNVRAVDFIKMLKRDYNIVSRPAKFNSEYSQVENVGTIGSRAILIASSDVTNAALASILRSFQASFLTMSKHGDTKQRSTGDRVLPLREGDLSNTVKLVSAAQKEDSDMLVKNFLLFLSTVILATIAVLRFVGHYVSNYKKHVFFEEVQGIAALCNHPQQNSMNVEDIVSHYAELRSSLGDIRSEMHQDFHTGGLSDDSMHFLEKSVDKTDADICRALKNRLVKMRFENSPESISVEDIVAELVSDGTVDSVLRDQWINRAK